MKTPIPLLFRLMVTSQAFAWGEQGHRGISEAVRLTLIRPQSERLRKLWAQAKPFHREFWRAFPSGPIRFVP